MTNSIMVASLVQSCLMDGTLAEKARVFVAIVASQAIYWHVKAWAFLGIAHPKLVQRLKQRSLTLSDFTIYLASTHNCFFPYSSHLSTTPPACYTGYVSHLWEHYIVSSYSQ